MRLSRCKGSSESKLLTFANVPKLHVVSQLDLNAKKPVFGVLQITQAQTSLRIPAVWSAPLLFPFCKVPYVNLLQVQDFNFVAIAVAEETGLKLALSETPKTGFIATWPNWYICFYVTVLKIGTTTTIDYWTSKVLNYILFDFQWSWRIRETLSWHLDWF